MRPETSNPIMIIKKYYGGGKNNRKLTSGTILVKVQFLFKFHKILH